MKTQILKKKEESRNRKYKFLLPLGHSFVDLNAACLTGFIPFLIAAYHYDYATATALVMFFYIINSIAQLVFGQIADKRNCSAFLFIGILLAAGGMGMIGVIDSFPLMCIFVTISGIGVAMYHPQAMKVLNAYTTDSEIGSDVSLFSLGGSIGMTAGPLIITAFVQVFGMNGSLLLFLFPLTFGILSRTVCKNATDISNLQIERDENYTIELHDGKESSDRWIPFVFLTIVVCGRSAAAGALNTFMSLYWINTLGQSDIVGNAALSIFSAMIALFTFFGGRIADKYGYRRMIILSFIILIPSLMLLAINTRLLPAAILMIPVSFGISLSYSPLIVLGQIYLPNHIGLSSGVTMGLATSIGSIMAPLLGKIADASSVGNAFLVLGIISCLPFLISFLLPQNDKC